LFLNLCIVYIFIPTLHSHSIIFILLEVSIIACFMKVVRVLLYYCLQYSYLFIMVLLLVCSTLIWLRYSKLLLHVYSILTCLQCFVLHRSLVKTIVSEQLRKEVLLNQKVFCFSLFLLFYGLLIDSSIVRWLYQSVFI